MVHLRQKIKYLKQSMGVRSGSWFYMFGQSVVNSKIIILMKVCKDSVSCNQTIVTSTIM